MTTKAKPLAVRAVAGAYKYNWCVNPTASEIEAQRRLEAVTRLFGLGTIECIVLYRAAHDYGDARAARVIAERAQA